MKIEHSTDGSVKWTDFHRLASFFLQKFNANVYKNYGEVDVAIFCALQSLCTEFIDLFEKLIGRRKVQKMYKFWCRTWNSCGWLFVLVVLCNYRLNHFGSNVMFNCNIRICFRLFGIFLFQKSELSCHLCNSSSRKVSEGTIQIKKKFVLLNGTAFVINHWSFVQKWDVRKRNRMSQKY